MIDLLLSILLELFTRGIWESGLFLFGTLTLAGVKTPVRRFAAWSALLALSAVLVRRMPISYGIHTLMIIIILNLVAIFIFHINLENSIKYTVLLTCVLFALEGINGLAILLLYGKDKLTAIQADTADKLLWFIPSIVLFFLFNLILSIVIKKRNAKKESTESA